MPYNSLLFTSYLCFFSVRKNLKSSRTLSQYVNERFSSQMSKIKNRQVNHFRLYDFRLYD